jgi:hypothetical protein
MHSSGSLLLKADTVTVIDDRQPGESEELCLSNFYAHEDRVTREIVMYMPRWFAHSADMKDWTASSYRCRIQV